MRYSLEPHYRRYVQGQGFMSFMVIKALMLVNL